MSQKYGEPSEELHAQRAASLRAMADSLKSQLIDSERDSFILIVNHNNPPGSEAPAEIHYIASMERGDAIRLLTDYLGRLKSGRN